MHQVDGQCEDPYEVNGDQPDLLEGDVDAAVDVLDGFVMAGISDHGQLVRKPHFDPEIAHVDTQEGEDQDTEDGPILGGPGSAGDLAGLVFGAFGFAVGQPEGDPLDGMEDNKGVQADRDDLDNGIVRHKSRVDIEGAASVVRQELEVSGHVDDQEGDQKQASQAHNHLLAQGRGEKTGKPVHSRSVCKGPAR